MDSAGVIERAIWGAETTQPVCIRLHVPSSGVARGTVLLCPPLGREHAVTHPTLRQLAEELAMEGFAALRLDYHGTGDSAGSQTDPDRVASWVESVRAGVEAARQLCDGPVAVVGMRMGALLAANALADFGDPVDLLVLWDPSVSGRAWLREQRALLSIGVGSQGFGAVPTEGDEAELAAALVGREGVLDIPSFTFSAAEADAISALRLPVGKPLARAVLALTRAESRLKPELQQSLEGQAVSWLCAPGQSELLVMAADFAVVPLEGLRTLVAELSRRIPNVGIALAETAQLPVAMTVAAEAGQTALVTEEHVRLGPVGLVGVRTRPAVQLAGAPMLIFIGNSVEPHYGPSRAWAELARRWAAAGVTSVRVCLSGLGDSAVRPGQVPQVVFAPESSDDVRDVVQALEPDDPRNVVLIGLCSGAYEAIAGALSLGARGVCALGLQPGAGASGAVHGGDDARRQASAPVRGWMRRASQSRRAWKIARRLPPWIWPVLDALGVLTSPALPLRRLVNAGVDTLFVVGTRDARAYVTFAETEVKRLERRGGLRFARVSALDHGMLRGRPREEALEILDDHVRNHFIEPFARVESF